jgi:hypothetical protein
LLVLGPEAIGNTRETMITEDDWTAFREKPLED